MDHSVDMVVVRKAVSWHFFKINPASTALFSADLANERPSLAIRSPAGRSTFSALLVRPR